MSIEIIIALAAGIIAGTFTGLVPGVHANLIALISLSAAPALLAFFSPVAIAIFILAVALTHTFVGVLPSIFLGAPDADNVMTVLPGHRMLMKGFGFAAVQLSVIGGILGVIAALVLAPIFYLAFPEAYSLMRPYLGFLLIGIVLFLLFQEPTAKRKLWALFVFIAAGIFGMTTLNLGIKEPLLPMLSGLFGLSILVVSMSMKSIVPEQNKTSITVRKGEMAKSALTGSLAGGLISLFPALGPSQAASIFSPAIERKNGSAYLITIGAISSANIVLSLLAVATFGKARNGTTAAIAEILAGIDAGKLFILLPAALVIAGVSSIIALKFAGGFAKLVPILNYTALSLAVILFVSALVFFRAGFLGMVVLAIGLAIGIVPNIVGIARSHSMGCLLLPVIIWLVV